MRAYVYRNLHRDCFSIRVGGRVRQHAKEVGLEDAKFLVQPAGQKRVLKTGRKNVHAFVVGLVDESGSEQPYRIHDGEAFYNPREVACFVDRDSKKPLTGTFRYVTLQMIGTSDGSLIRYWR